MFKNREVKLRLLFGLKLVVGTSLLFVDLLFGSLILFAALITLIWLLKSSLKFYYLHLALSLVMFLGAFLIYFISDALVMSKVFVKLGIGFVLFVKFLFDLYK
ncbi:MAG: hypothetical protein ACMXX9_02430 [Candidatus Woesearchaeota archaeon]